MINLVVVDQMADWDFKSENFEIVEAKKYLTEPQFAKTRKYRVFNLCQSYAYCSQGYYISLVAQARDHGPSPSVSTILDFQLNSVLKVFEGDLQDLIQRDLSPLKGLNFELSIYFGQNLSQKYETLAKRLFDHFRAPLLRAKFEKKRDYWKLTSVRPVSSLEIPPSHKAFVQETMRSFFSRKSLGTRKQRRYRYDLAILRNPNEVIPPSDEKALKGFIRAAEELRIQAEFIEQKDFSKIPTFDALFIRETTDVNHHTFRFARRAEAEGLIVIDDPQSILRCCNKIYLFELLQGHNILTPKTRVFDAQTTNSILDQFAFPLILKQPDSAFCKGVKKVENQSELEEVANDLFAKTDLLLAQEYIPTEYDWRVGLIDGQPLFVCRYYMAKAHWQIIKAGDDDSFQYGRAEVIHLYEAPKKLIELATEAAALVGDGLYGVDVKQIGQKFYVIEVNDNPNIDSGVEDRILKENLYLEVMKVFQKRLDAR